MLGIAQADLLEATAVPLHKLPQSHSQCMSLAYKDRMNDIHHELQ